MITTVNLYDLEEIVKANLSNPHKILGIHRVEDKNIKLSIRVFIPQAKNITVIELENSRKKYNMEKIHVDGFFEVKIEDREDIFKYKLKIEGYEKNKWHTRDPYSFKNNIISDFDIHLFGEGNHYKIFDKLGSNLINVEDVQGVHFAVWAPNSKRVSVIGDFNSWDGRRCPMRLLGSSGIWELFIPHIKEFENYKFEIKTNAGDIIEKSDPYSTYFECRPKTSSKVFNINKYIWTDEEWLKKRLKEDVLDKPINIYEVHLGSWKKKYTEDESSFFNYKEIAEALISYVIEMGYTHIELLPLSEHPYDGSWGYQVTGYYAPSSRYGTPDEFMYFINKCHQNNIGVILDWVPGHFANDVHGLVRFDGTALYEHEDYRKGQHLIWGTYIFNYGRNEVRNFLIGNVMFWIEKYHIDGIRMDAIASMLYLDYDRNEGEWMQNEYGSKENIEAIEFLKHMNSIIEKKYKNVLIIAEESTTWRGVTKSVAEGGLGFNLKWNMGWMNDFLSYIEKDPIYRKYEHNKLTFSMMYAYTEKFILTLSHDEVVHLKKSMLGKMPGDIWQKFANLRLSYGFMYGHPGKKLLFMGSEFAQHEEWNYKEGLHWFLLDYDNHKNMQLYVKDLNNFYKTDKPLWEIDFSYEGFQWIDCDNSDMSVVSFIRKSKSGDITIFVCNFTPIPNLNFRLGVPYKSAYKEVLNSDNIKYSGSGIINIGVITSENIPYNFRDYSIVIKIPPLGITVLKMDK